MAFLCNIPFFLEHVSPKLGKAQPMMLTLHAEAVQVLMRVIVRRTVQFRLRKRRRQGCCLEQAAAPTPVSLTLESGRLINSVPRVIWSFRQSEQKQAHTSHSSTVP